MSRSKYINTFDTTAEYDSYIESALPEFPNVGYDKESGEVKIIRTSPNNHLFYGELVDATQNIPNIQLYNNNSKVKTYTPTVDTLTNEFYIDDWGTVPTFNKLSNNFLTNRSNIKSIKKFKGLNTSSVTTMNAMLDGTSSLTSVNLSSLDTSLVNDMNNMFRNSSATLIDISFNTSNVLTMKYMFSGAAGVKVLDLSSFNVSKVTDMEYMLSYCPSLKVLDLSNWDILPSTSCNNIFYNTTNITDVYITVESTLMKLTNNLTSQGTNYIPASATIHYNGTDYKWQNNAWTPQSV